MTKAEKIGTIKAGDVYRVVAPLDKTIIAFQEEGIQTPYLADTQDLVETRLEGISDTWSRTSIAPVSAKNEPTILIRGIHNPLMNLPMAISAVNAHRRGEYVELPREFYDNVKQIAQSEDGRQPEDRTAIILPSNEDFELISEMPTTQFLLGQRAKEYFEKNNHNKINFYNLPTDKNSARINYVWFDVPRSGSNLISRDGVLYDVASLGVRKKTAEGGSQNSGYVTLTNVEKRTSEAIHEIFGATPKLEQAVNDAITGRALDKLRR